MSTSWPHHGPADWPVFVINCVGAFVLGGLLEALTRLGPDEGLRRKLRLAVGTGFCGAFTTYSTFAHDVVGMMRQQLAPAVVWGVGHVLAGVFCALIGAWCGHRFTARPVETSR